MNVYYSIIMFRNKYKVIMHRKRLRIIVSLYIIHTRFKHRIALLLILYSFYNNFLSVVVKEFNESRNNVKTAFLTSVIKETLVLLDLIKLAAKQT